MSVGEPRHLLTRVLPQQKWHRSGRNIAQGGRRNIIIESVEKEEGKREVRGWQVWLSVGVGAFPITSALNYIYRRGK